MTKKEANTQAPAAVIQRPESPTFDGHKDSGHELIDNRVYIARRDAVQQIAKAVMKEGLHYGLPFKGAGTPSLQKPGAEVLASVFQFSPKYRIERVDLANDHREYTVICELFNMHTGSFLGEGLGLCTTMESKYRYRNIDRATGVTSPYEDNKIKESKGIGAWKKQLAKRLTDAGVSFTSPDALAVGKVDGSWQIVERAKGQNPDIADTFNTVLKIAKKRAFVDAIMSVTGASEFFTQDLEDFKGDNGMGVDFQNAPGPAAKIQESEPVVPDPQRDALLAEAPKSLKADIAGSQAGTEARELLINKVAAYNSITPELGKLVEADAITGDYANAILKGILEAPTEEILQATITDTDKLAKTLAVEE